MNKIYLLSATMIMTLLAAGCADSTDMTELMTDNNEIRFNALYPGTSSRATASAFEEGDRMGVFITQYDGATATPLQLSGNFANNISSTLTAGKWVNAPAVFWEDGKYDIYAYYPYTKVNSVDNLNFSVNTDQSTLRSNNVPGGYEASDLLWTRREGVSRSESVDLTFKHILSCVRINLVKGDNYTGELPSEAEVYIHNTYNEALVDLSSGIVEKNGY
ncbi:MAG: fimbrillin family protein, partial [Muribaculaceae bacterium]|nr:fimbrillin family protein [Muribaculaceae bacterium]